MAKTAPVIPAVSRSWSEKKPRHLGPTRRGHGMMCRM